MAEKTFKLEIISPTKVVFKGDVISISVPGVMGGFQVLYNHAPLLAEIGIGEIKIQKPDGSEEYFATSGGYVDVVNNDVLVLAETVERPIEIDVARAENAKERALKKLSQVRIESDRDITKVELERALNRLRIAERRK